jgi:ATP-dependent helicase/nuclease subunit B
MLMNPRASDDRMANFQVHTTPYGRPAVDLLATQLVAAKHGDALAPVTVIVSSNYAGVSTRRALAGRPGGLANVSFLTLFRLAERLGAASLAAVGRRPVSTPFLAQALRAVLAGQPGVFAPVADHPATELALVAATRELAGLNPGALDAVAACSPRAGDVVRIARQVRGALAPAWYDEHDLLGAATVALEQGGTAGPVIVHLLQEVSPAAGELLQALAERETVSVNVGVTGDLDADRHVLDAHARAGVTVNPGPVEPPLATTIISVSDPDEEVRAAIRQTTDWMRAGIRLGRIALLYGATDPYARLLHEQLEAAGLPHQGAPVRDVGNMLLGRTVRALLALPDHRFRRRDVLAVVTGAPLRDGNRDGGGLAPGRAWERISRAAGVVDDDDWDRRLAVFGAEQRRRADEAERDDQDRRADHLRRDADRAQRLAAFVARLRADLESLAAETSWAAMVDATHRLVRVYLGGERHRLRWPDEEQQAAERVEEILDRLAGLDAVGGPPPTVDVFRRTLEGELEVSLRRVGHYGEGVLIGPVSIAAGIELDRAVVLGLAEGTFPPRRLEDSLLHDDERRAAAGQLLLRADRVHDDHRHLLAAMAAAAETALSFPRGDLRRHGDRAASRWLLADAARLSGQDSLFTEELEAQPAGWLHQVPSYAAGLARVAFPATAQDLRLAAMLRQPEPVLAGDPVLALGADLARSRRSSAFTRFDGNLTGVALPDYSSSGATSATRLQAWTECPHAFLLQYLLGVDAVEDVERQLEMNPLDKGSLIHEILDRFVAEQIVAGRSAPWVGNELDRLLEIAENVFIEYGGRGVTGRAMFWRRDRARILADLERFAALDDGRPLDTEMSFADVAYPLPGGRSVRFRGAIDRVDDLGAGSARVTDYKTGSTRGYEGLSPTDPHQGGTRLQLAVYGRAVQQELGREDVDTGYWFVTERGKFGRIGYQLTSEVLAQVGEALATIVDGIRSGMFPSRPPAVPAFLWVDCWYCAPDGLSAAEARRDWERKRADATLFDYVRMVEPEALDDHR